MPRPRPTILLEHTDVTGKTHKVLQATGMYAVCHDDQPVGLRTNTKAGTFKYKRSIFVNPGHALNLAHKLNQMFHTDRFRMKTYKEI